MDVRVTVPDEKDCTNEEDFGTANCHPQKEPNAAMSEERAKQVGERLGIERSEATIVKLSGALLSLCSSRRSL